MSKVYDSEVEVLITVKVKIHENGCWESNIRQDSRGYTSVLGQGGHRIFYKNFVGEIPDGYHVDHRTCDTPWCVNPDHLLAVTPEENVLRSSNPAAKNARKRRCSNGHSLSGKNVLIHNYRGRDVRRCRKCAQDIRAKKRLSTDSCGLDDCDNRLFARGVCQAHYARWYRAGKPDGDPIQHFAPQIGERIATQT